MKSQATTTKSYSINGLMVICALLLSTISIAQTTVTLEDQCNCEVLQGTDVSAPGAITPIGADLGDLYVNTTSGTIYFWDGDSWELTTAANTDNQQLQNFTFDAATNVLTLDLENGGSVNVNLTDLQDTLVDTNTTNNRIEVAGPNLVITDSENNTISIPLADIAAATDTNTTNATFTVVGTDLVITDSENNTVSVPVADIAALADTDDQALSLAAGNILTLEDGGTVDLTPYLDNTDDQQITAFSLDGATNVLTLTLEDGGTQTVDLSNISTDDQALSLAAGNILTLEDGGTVDLTPYLDNTDDQTATEVAVTDAAGNFTATDVEGALAELATGSTDDQALSLAAGNILTLEDGGTVDLTPYLDNTDDQTAAEVTIVDAAGNFTATEVEGALAELALASTDDQFDDEVDLRTPIDVDEGGVGSPTLETNVEEVIQAIAPITSKAARIFYPPSIAVDVSTTGNNRTIDLYAQYLDQYGGTAA
ncbi:MAG: hypothetical protein WBB27_01935, partial [Maribacter sp.]